MKKAAIELFAGVGGFHLGLAEEFEVKWANQWEPGKKNQDAYNCYKERFPNTIIINDDIGKVNLDDIPYHDLLVGGFPCQDYSVSSTGAKGIEGKKGVLFWEIKRILEDKKPEFVLLENVDRLLKSPTKQRGRDFGIMLKVFDEMGYVVEWRVINAADYGYPQKRRRIFIYATRKEEQKKIYINKEEYIEKSFFNSIFEVTKKEHEKHKPSEGSIKEIDLLEVSNTFKLPFKNAGYMKDGYIYTEEVTPVKRKKTTLSSLLETTQENKFYLENEEFEKWKYLKGPKKIPRKTKEGFEYTYSEGGMAFPDHLDEPGRTMLTSEGSVNRSSHVVIDPKTKKIRKITPLEAERLNGFPDNWTEGMSDRMRYFCMGNALVVGLIKEMSKELNSRMKKS